MKDNKMTENKAKVSVIIITLNEEKNIEQCLQSIYGWSNDIHIVDSNSTDNTVEIAKKYTDNIHTVGYRGNWATIRQWALSTIYLNYEWVLFVDADEWLTEKLKNEIIQKVNSNPDENGFYIQFKFIFMNKWIKYGGQYAKVLRLFRHNKVHCVPNGDGECYVPEGKVGMLKNDFIHQDLKPFSAWIDKHNKTSLMAAERYMEIKKGKTNKEITAGSWLGMIWDKAPLLLRPFLMFFHIYIIKLGFLDGKEGLIYHLHHAFWYQLLIYTKIKEMEIRQVQRRKLL